MADKKSYTMHHVNMAYSAFSGASFDLKNGLSTDGVTISMAEDFGERTVGADGRSLWSEYMSENGTVTISIMSNSPAYAFFTALQNAQRITGTKGRDSITIANTDFNEAFTCADVAIQSIGEVKYDKAGNASRPIVFNCGKITRVAS